MKVFYDLLCPDSMNAHYLWKKILAEDSHVEGKKYSELIDMKASTFVLPYHDHSWVVSRVIPYLQDVCAEDSTKCFITDYAELAWAHWNTDLSDTSVSANEFVKKWAAMVHDKIPDLSVENIEALFGENDKHNTE